MITASARMGVAQALAVLVVGCQVAPPAPPAPPAARVVTDDGEPAILLKADRPIPWAEVQAAAKRAWGQESAVRSSRNLLLPSDLLLTRREFEQVCFVVESTDGAPSHFLSLLVLPSRQAFCINLCFRFVGGETAWSRHQRARIASVQWVPYFRRDAGLVGLRVASRLAIDEALRVSEEVLAGKTVRVSDYTTVRIGR